MNSCEGISTFVELSVGSKVPMCESNGLYIKAVLELIDVDTTIVIVIYECMEKKCDVNFIVCFRTSACNREQKKIV